MWRKSEIRDKGSVSSQLPGQGRAGRKECGAERDLPPGLKRFPDAAPCSASESHCASSGRKTVLCRGALWPQDSWTDAPQTHAFPFLTSGQTPRPPASKKGHSRDNPGSMARRPRPSLQGLHKLCVLSNTLLHHHALSVPAPRRGPTPRALFRTSSHEEPRKFVGLTRHTLHLQQPSWLLFFIANVK